jgi:hypothetical protein
MRSSIKAASARVCEGADCRLPENSAGTCNAVMNSGHLLFQNRECFPAVFCAADAEAQFFEALAQLSHRDFIVVGHQYPLRQRARAVTCG